jgi:hypothetical protein
MKVKNNKLTLKQETLRYLNAEELTKVVGGFGTHTCGTTPACTEHGTHTCTEQSAVTCFRNAH